ncbi:hypothetical protein [Nonlabens xiamenensis]|uniref:hypothetical protein n=1 Tax=Nonlabens xiamenensis TaxID=2341043 RepID=UPI000F61145E|nr:hypothetical protein [Nonlabens xiamenensis]
MVPLQEYLGTLISSVNQARVMADVESARIAQVYAGDDLLKNFPVPRFRAQDIELDIPVAIDGFDQQQHQPDYQPIDNKSFNTSSYALMKDAARVSSFSRKTSSYLNSKIAQLSQTLETDLKANVPKEEAFKKYEDAAGSLFSKAIEMDRIASTDQDQPVMAYKSLLRNNLKSQVTGKTITNKLENARVIVEAGQLREIPNESIIRIKMKLFEDGMEWHSSSDPDGQVHNRLLPE